MTTGMAAMGKPIPYNRKSAALETVRAMVPGISTEEGMAVVDSVSLLLQRDQPYQAQKAALKTLNLTGTYRLIAVLLSEPS